MKTLRMLSSGLLTLGSAAILAVPLTGTGARQAGGQAVPIDADDLGGVVTGPKGPEAGVWVIAETTDLPTKFAKIVVTDEQGRYVVPDLPKANYSVWVRGYGLVDSPKTQATPGKVLNLTAVVAPNRARGSRVLSGGLLVFAAPSPRQERVSGHRSGRQRYLADDWESGAVASQHEVGQLLGVPSHSGPRARASCRRILGRSHPRLRRGSVACSRGRPGRR